MPAGNWNYKQKLNTTTGRVEWPTGPLVLSGSEKPTWLDAWITQRSTGASQKTHATNFTSTTQWAADGWDSSPWTEGKFKPGPAVGIALVATRDAQGNSAYFWWVDEILLG